MTREERDLLIVNHMPLARKLAWGKCSNTPDHISYEELESAAYLGLVDAASKFDEARGVSFGLYARFRITGAICDYLRELEWCSNNRDVVVSFLDVTVGDYPLSYFLESQEPNETFCEFLEVVTKDLDENGKKIVSMYYLDELSLKEIGKVIGVSEGRVSQLLKKYREQIRDRWDYLELAAMAA